MTLPTTTGTGNLRSACPTLSQVRKCLVDVIQFCGEFRDAGFRSTAGVSFQIDAGHSVYPPLMAMSLTISSMAFSPSASIIWVVAENVENTRRITRRHVLDDGNSLFALNQDCGNE
jgi:hypothetical protein